MAVLANLDELKAALGDQASDQDEIGQLFLDGVENELQELTGQTFEAGGDVLTDQPHHGSGSSWLWLERKPATLDADVKIGAELADPDDTIDDADVVLDDHLWRLRYLDGIWPPGHRNVWVSYTTAANVPLVAKMGVLEETVRRIRMRGSEHLRGQTFLELGRVDLLQRVADRDSWWSKAVRQLDRRRYV
jgi:hypothetical protein